MNYRVKKYLFVALWCSIVTAGCIVSISYIIVKHFTSRRSRDAAWYIKTNLYKQNLCATHNAIPLSFTTKDGLTLAGLLFVRENAKYNLLVCHGYSRYKEDMRTIVSLFPDQNMFFFDYRAHGESEGVATTIGHHEILDVFGALAILQTHEKTKDLPVVGIGFSMGAATLLGAAVQGASFKGLVVDSVFKRLDEQIAKMFGTKTGLPQVPFVSMCQTVYKYLFNCDMSEVNPFAWIQQLQMPMLIIHAKNDTLADAAVAQELFDIKEGYKKLWIVEHAPHATIYKHYPQEYAQQVNNFLSSLSDSSQHS